MPHYWDILPEECYLRLLPLDEPPLRNEPDELLERVAEPDELLRLLDELEPER